MIHALNWLRSTWPPRRQANVAGAYRTLFGAGSAYGPLVLQDLARFCCVGATTAIEGESDRAAFINEGRRQVYLHICDLAQVDATQLLREIA